MNFLCRVPPMPIILLAAAASCDLPMDSVPNHDFATALWSVPTALGGFVPMGPQTAAPVQDSIVVPADVDVIVVPTDTGTGNIASAPVAGVVLPVVAILVSLVAIYMSRRLSTAGFRARESVNDDIAQLLASLRAIVHKGGNALTSDDELVTVEREQRQIADFTVSTTAYAMHAWIQVKAEEPESTAWRVLPLQLARLQQSIHPLRLARLAAEIEALFRSMTDEDIKRIRRYASEVQEGLEPFLDSANALVEALVDTSADPFDKSKAVDIEVDGKPVKADYEIDRNDVYRFVVEEPGYYTIVASGEGGSGELDAMLVILYADDGRTGMGMELSRLREHIEAGAYYVCVFDLEGGTGSYQVSVSSEGGRVPSPGSGMGSGGRGGWRRCLDRWRGWWRRRGRPSRSRPSRTRRPATSGTATGEE